MNSIDFVIIIPLLVGFILGVFKGLIRELASLAAIFLGIYAAKLFSPIFSDMLQSKVVQNSHVANVLAYVVVFVIVAVFLLMMAKWMDRFFDAVSLGFLNKIAGGVFGALKYALLVSVLINLIDAVDSKFTIIHKDTKAASLFYNPIKKLGPDLWTEAKTYNTHSQRSNYE